jgi:polysaccharide biosynthesis transport protein
MMIETRNSQILQKSPVGELRPDGAWIESQIGILKSVNVAAYVVKQLRLADDPEFFRSNGLFDKLLARLGWEDPEPTSDAERTAAAIGTVMGGLDVRRVGQSYMMRIDFSSRNREQAAKIAGAMIDAYIFDQLNSKYQANRRAGDWLQERLQALREQAAAAERAVVEFKAKNNIVTSGGTLMNEKQLTDMSSQVAAARTQASDVAIRLERVGAVRRAYQAEKPASAAEDENVIEAMSNPIITKLREKYLELGNREANWSLRYGKNHLAVVNLRNQIRDIRKSIYDELGRIEETWKSDYEVAKKRKSELEQSLGALVSQSTETNQARVALFSLEASAQSYRKLYDNFLQQHTESVQQQTFPISDARALSPAGATKTSPQMLKVWLVTTFAGVMLGVGLGAFREIMDRGFRTRDQVRSVLGTDCIALFPLLPDERKRLFSRQQALALPRNEVSAYQSAPRSIYSSAKIIRTIVNSPSSPYADAIRSIKLTVDQNGEAKYSKVIGITSCLPSEGKSTLAAAAAALIAQSGARVVLVDCDLRRPALSRALAPDASAGFIDVVAGNLELEDAVWNDPTTDMAFLPAGANPEVASATEIVASETAKSLFGTMQIKYDYVIVDLPPLAAGVDVRAMSGLIDSYILVIEWGATKVDAVQYALRHAPDVQENIVGAVLNKVNIPAMSRYDSHGARDYYGRPRYKDTVH